MQIDDFSDRTPQQPPQNVKAYWWACAVLRSYEPGEGHDDLIKSAQRYVSHIRQLAADDPRFQHHMSVALAGASRDEGA